MVSGRAIHRGVGAGRVVGDHSAQSGARRGGHIGPEPQPVRREVRVELIEDHPRTNTHRSPLEIEIGDAPVVAGEIDHQPVAEGSARQPGAGAAWDDLDSGVRGHGQQLRRLRRGAWESHRRRLDPVNRRINRVEAAGEPVGPHIAARGVESSSP